MKKYLILFALFLISLKVISQNFPDNPTQIQEIPPSPTMWEFDKYGNYPVSMHTGVPSISIPIATASSGSLRVPILLNYHASGIKVDEKASWVGLGWSLSAGGAITRTIRGSHDEKNDGYINYPYNAENTLDPEFDYWNIEQMTAGFIDTEPDIFNYRFLGYSGRFIFNHSSDRTNATIALIPHNDLIVKPVFTGASITSFTIVTPEGITAEFAYPEQSSEYRENLIQGTLFIENNTWHLKKLTAANGIDEITLTYKTIGTVSDERISERESISYYDPCLMTNNTLSTSTRDNVTAYYDVKQIEKITFKNGYINFVSTENNRIDDPDNEGLRLDEIEMYSSINSVDEIVKSYNLEYDYFGYVNPSGGTPEYNVRLRLEKVIEEGSNGTQKNPHVFTYSESAPYHDLPPRFDADQDYWGYYNNKANSTTIPEVEYLKRDGINTIYLGDADRDVNPLYAGAGVISKITYPTLGYTEFDFESNTTTIMDGTTPVQHYTGGQRIKSITNYDQDDSVEWQKSYEYTQKSNSSLSSGVYNSLNYIKPKDYLSTRPYYFNAELPGCSRGYVRTHITYTDGVASSPAMSNNFATVFYSEVKEYNGSPTTHEGYKWYHYASSRDKLVQGLGPISFYIDRSWDRGQLLLEETYENGNSSPITSVTNVYDTIHAQSPVSAYKAATRFDVQHVGFLPLEVVDQIYFRSNQYFLTYYEEPIVRKRLRSTTIIQDGITTQNNFYYENPEHVILTKTETTDSKGNTLITRTRYPDDIKSISTLYDNSSIVGGALTSFDAIKKLKSIDLNNSTNLNRINEPIQVETYEKNGSTETLVSLQRTEYVDKGGNIVMPEFVKTLKGEFNSTTNPLIERIIYHAYDSNGNPTEISKTEGSHTFYIWGYNEQYPIAKIENATYSQVSSFVSNLQTLSDNDDSVVDEDTLRSAQNTMRNDSSLVSAMVTTYTYDPLIGVTSITDPKGYTIYYQYDDFGRLEFVKDHNGKVLSKNEYHYKGQ